MSALLEKLVVRRIRVEDAPAIGRIQSAITKSPVKTDFRKIIEEQVRKEDEEASFVAELDGKVAGYMISYLVYAGFGLDKSAWIATMGVEPKFMGQGIGRKLAGEIFAFYRERGIYDILTSVRWDSADLMSFFKTSGFELSIFINLKKRLES